MSNVDELPDLVGDVRDRAVPPPYEQVTRRVRARRGRTAAGTLAATALAVGGLAVWQNAATTASPSPSPAPSIPQAADPAYPASEAWQQVVEGTRSHVFDVAGTADGSVAVVWRALEDPGSRFALVIREADGTVHGRLLEEPLSLVPVPGGWVGLRTDRAWFIASDGTWTDLGEPGPARDPRPGDVVLAYAAPTLFSPDDLSWSYLLADGAAYVTPDGRVVSCRPEGDQLLVTADGATPTHGRGTACLLVGQGDHVTMAGTRDGEGGGVWLYSLLATHDGGATWRDGRIPSDLDLASVTVDGDGTSYVTGTDGRLFVTLADGDIREPTGEYGVVVAAGDRVYSLSYARDHGPLRYSDDHGSTWSETTLPGLE